MIFGFSLLIRILYKKNNNYNMSIKKNKINQKAKQKITQKIYLNKPLRKKFMRSINQKN